MNDIQKFRESFVFKGCETCPAKTLPKVIVDAEPTVFDRADVLFFGVNPGSQEAKQGIPFCGPAGQLLRRVAKKYLTGRVLAYTNIMLCSTGNERAIPQAEICFAQCRENVRAISRFCHPRVYVPCGNFAMRAFGITEGSISRNQGRLFQKNGCMIIPSLHPSAILRGFSSEKALEKTMQTLANVLSC